MALPANAKPENRLQADMLPMTAAYLSTTGDMPEVRPQAAARMDQAAASIGPQPKAAASQTNVDQWERKLRALWVGPRATSRPRSVPFQWARVCW